MDKLRNPSYEKEAIHYLVSGIGATALRSWMLNVPVSAASVLSLAGPTGLLLGQYAGEMAVPYVLKRLNSTIANAAGTQGFGSLEGKAGTAVDDAVLPYLLPVVGGFVVVFLAGRGTVTDALAMTIGSAGALAAYDYLTTSRDFLRLKRQTQ